MKKNLTLKSELLKEELTVGGRVYLNKKVSDYQEEMGENKKKIADSLVGGGLCSVPAIFGGVVGTTLASKGLIEGAAILYLCFGVYTLFVVKYGKDAYSEIRHLIELKEDLEIIREALKIDQDLKSIKKNKVKAIKKIV